jgi:pantetheine-phosphate adenylyltransferase
MLDVLGFLRQVAQPLTATALEQALELDQAGLWPRASPAILRLMRAQKRQLKLGVYAGSFDPLTVGHLWMIQQGVQLFDRLTVAIGVNSDKKYSFPLAERRVMLRESTRQFPNVSVASFSNRFLIHYAQNIGATHILRGIRTESDYEFERTMRNINGDLDPEICTIFLMPPRGIAEVSSSMVRGLIGPVGWQKILRKYVPDPVYKRLLKSRA